MFVNVKCLAVNPFFDAYVQSDTLGRGIFIGLIMLSIITWVILIHKVWLTYEVKKNSLSFQKNVEAYKGNLLNADCSAFQQNQKLNPFFNLFVALKRQTVEILTKNRHFAQSVNGEEQAPSYLSPTDIDVVESHLFSTAANQIKFLEKNLFILATVVSLAPFLGLLGTVWGILTTFSEMQMQSGVNSSQAILGGLSLALATTVLGLVDAIPALIGYNYLKNTIGDFETEMASFSNQILASVEMQYRKVDIK